MVISRKQPTKRRMRFWSRHSFASSKQTNDSSKNQIINLLKTNTYEQLKKQSTIDRTPGTNT
jgi:hypothetical protein